MIEKKVHYIWLGKNQKPKNFSISYESWQKFLVKKGFQIQEWNEESAKEFDLPNYYHKAIKEKQYAFASDVLRVYILEKYGGIYLDIDQVVLKEIPDFILDCNFFTAYYHNSKSYFGFQFVGFTKNNFILKEMINFYKEKEEDYIIINLLASKIINKIIQENKNSLKNINQDELNIILKDNFKIKIFSQEYFYSEINNFKFIDKAYSFHFGNTSWVPTWKKVLQKIPFYTFAKNIFIKIVPKSFLKKIKNIEY